MQALAEFAMRGWKNAAALAFILGFLPFCGWIAVAIVALVLMRQGFTKALPVLLWGALPPLVTWVMVGDVFSAPLFVLVLLAAHVLRQWVSMLYAVVALALGSIVVHWLILAWSPAGVANITKVMEEIFSHSSLVESMGGTSAAEFAQVMLQTSYGFSLASSALASLLLARWWQAQLFNPGGFKEEFQGLRLPPVASTAIVVVAWAAASQGGSGTGMALVAVVPMFAAGISLVHSIANRFSASGGFLFGFYALLFILGPSLLLPLLILTVFDSFIDIRARLANNE